MTDIALDSILFRRLEKSDDRSSFDCGVQPLNEFLQKYARQNQTLSISVTYIAILPPQNNILGYYTLSSADILFEHIPKNIRRKLPHYPIPVTRIGRLARDLSIKGKGFGKFLLIDAFARILRISEELGIHGIEVDAKDKRAKLFYQSFGFEELLDDDLHLYISLKTVKAAFQ